MPEAPASAWNTTFEVADADDTVARASAAGGTCSPWRTLYGRMSTVHDPFGAEFTVGARPRR